MNAKRPRDRDGSGGMARRLSSMQDADYKAQRKTEGAMRKGLVDVVERLLGPAPTHVYDYGMQMPWTLRARQWVADQRRPAAIFPIHCWSAGVGGPQSPMTWFACGTCRERTLGSPDAFPERDCMRCLFSDRDFTGWEVADEAGAFVSTLEAAKGLPSHSFDKVMNGPALRA